MPNAISERMPSRFIRNLFSKCTTEPRRRLFQVVASYETGDTAICLLTFKRFVTNKKKEIRRVSRRWETRRSANHNLSCAWTMDGPLLLTFYSNTDSGRLRYPQRPLLRLSQKVKLLVEMAFFARPGHGLYCIERLSARQ